MDSLKMRVARLRSKEDGFSLIDVVVTVAIIVALSVGGFVSYNGIVNHAKQGAVDYAASNVYRSAVVMENDGDDDTNACTAVDRYNKSSEGIAVSLIVPAAGDTTTPVDKMPTYYGSDHGVGGKTPLNTYTC